MPASLAILCDYAEECVDRLRAIYPYQNTGNTLLGGAFQVPTFPNDAIPPLKECIEYADEEDAKLIAECIRRLQIQHSRLSELLHQILGLLITNNYLKSMICDTVQLHAYCSSLYPYARIEKPYDAQRPWHQFVRASALSCGSNKSVFPSIFDSLSRRNKF